MTSESNDDRSVAFSEGYMVPIMGLLSVLFALMTGMSLWPALSGTPSDFALPVIFGIATVISFRLRQRAIAAQESE